MGRKPTFAACASPAPAPLRAAPSSQAAGTASLPLGLISVLAYRLLTWIRQTLRARGDTRDWKTLRRLFSTHSLGTTVLPLRDGRVPRIRKPPLPAPEQALLSARTLASRGNPLSLPSNPSPTSDDFVVPLRPSP